MIRSRLLARAPAKLRDVEVGPLLVTLRSALGLDPFATAPGELAARRGRTLPKEFGKVDSGAWIAWALTGLVLFSRGRTPSRRELEGEARRVLYALLMERTGANITHVAETLDASRRVVREHLKALGLYCKELWRADGGARDDQ